MPPPAPVYSRARVWLHWAAALLVAGMIALGTVMGGLERGDPLRPLLLQWHLVAGLSVLAITLVRLTLVRLQPGPGLPGHYTRGERWLAGGVHASLYALMLLLPLFGLGIWLLDPYLLDTPGRDFALWRSETAAWLHRCHFVGAWLLAGLATIHIVGALRGVFSRRPGPPVLRRMLWPPRARSGGPSSSR